MANSQTLTLNIKALFDASDVKAKVGDIQSSLSKLKLPDKLATDLNKSFTGVNKALDDFISRTEKGIKTKSDASGITRSFENVSKELTNLDNLMIKVKSQLGDGVDLSKIIKFDGSVKEKLENINKEITVLQQKINSINTAKLKQLETALAQITSKGAREQGAKALELFNTGDLVGASQVLDSIIAKLKAVKTANETQGHNTANIENNIKLLETMQNAIQDAQRQTTSLITEQNAKIAEGAQVAKNASEEYVNGLNKQMQGLHQVSSETSGLTSKINDLASSQAQFVREVDQVKSRIQYFFGLSNAINLVKRAVRGAVETIKDLDKAMTETAVVTDFTVSDMWKQLPEYTKRANELGVTTQAAYEAATLYYQQGLNNEEVNALSVETLKMARIAGLDAAEATDRMTNALRGFNMELDTANAQRVDDVYSELAANTASNVDEISTAMTKVASLAHSANMEFETTAAFLAQIIETTRESAETAGTALKTVAARFSEVKKLVDTNQLKGQDEEGQIVDVNKVSAALRTAGIDLNKYFLGEVGLDDIFMELASKWDSLTSVQQRYIATQAAGSRQQSRFIALMQDYARTQELVGKAYNAEGASARQFEKTQESLESKLNRLKNAWNEFLMGLTNNVMVKTVVDALTTLLNLINKITSAFGDGAGSILKWTVALGTLSGLRRLFTDGGLATQLIGGLMGHGLGANRLRSSMGLGVMDATTQQYTAYSAQQLKANRGTTIIGGLGSGLKSFGTKAWNTAGALGSIYGLEGMAAGLTGVATALGAVAAAVAVVYAGYQAWLNLTPKGQLKQAKQYAAAMQDIVEADKQRANNLASIQKQYDEYNESISSAGSINERNTAIAKRNEYITSLLEQDAAYAEYISSVIDESGQFVLTLDENALAEAANKAAEAAVKSAISGNLLNANVQRAQAYVYQSQIEDIVNQSYGQLSSEDEAQIQILKSQIASLTTAAQNETAIAARQMLASSGLETEMANTLADVYAKTFNSQEYQRQLKRDSGVGQFLGNDLWRGISGSLQREYESIYGAGSSVGKKWNEMSLAVSSNKLAEKEETRLTNAAELVSSGDYDEILKAISGQIDFSDEDIEAANDKLQKFADILELNIADIQQQIKQNQKARQEIKRNRQTNIYERLLQSGAANERYNLNQGQSTTTAIDNYQAFLDTLDFEGIAAIEKITSQAESLLGDKLGDFMTELPDLYGTGQFNAIQKLFDNIDLDDPISAFAELEKYANQTTTAVGKYAKAIKDANADLFTSSNLVKSFIASADYEDITEELAKFVEENEAITSDNVDELAKSCKGLKTLIDNNVASAKSLAEVFTLLEKGAITFDQITDSLLKALEAGKSFESIIADVNNWVDNFDQGNDLAKGADHVVSILEDLKKYVDNWEFGNEPVENIYDHLFGAGKYQDYIESFGDFFDPAQAEVYLNDIITRYTSLFENEGLGAIQQLAGNIPGLTALGNNLFDWDLSQIGSTANAIGKVAEQLGITEEAAESLILAWQTHIPGLRTEWNNLAFDEQIAAYVKNLGSAKVITEQELSALAAATGHSVDEIKAKLVELAATGDINIPIIVNFQDADGNALTGDNLYQAFLKKFGSFSGTSTLGPEFQINWGTELANAVIDQYENGINSYDPSQVLSYFTERGLSSAQATEMANRAISEVQGSFSKEVEVPVTYKVTEGNEEIWKTETKTITVEADTVEGLDAAINTALEAANYESVATAITNQDFSKLGDKIIEAGKTGGEAAATLVATALNSIKVEQIKIHYQFVADNSINIPTGITGGGISSGNTNPVTGGIVGSHAGGSEHFHVKPGTSLTGEEGPEIVWNKDGQYAYITGQNGPEFANLRPGDRIFNAPETRRILRNSNSKGGIIDSYASGGWKPSGGSGGDGGGSSSDDDYKKESTWRNELDWLYNLMEDIAEYEHQQTIIQTRNEMALKDVASSGRDLYNLTLKELTNLETQLDGQQAAQVKRLQQMGELQTQVNAAGYGQYMQWNDKDKTLEIDWDAIEAIQDKETYDEVMDWLNRMEGVQDQIDDAEDAMWDIRKQIQDLQQRYLQQYLEFQNRVLQAVVKQYQDQIDKLSELNGTLNDTNTSILDSIQREIDLERQIRDNTDTESNIADMEARLAYLQRDTTGANASEIRELEKQIDEARESYSDSLVDQAIDRLAQSNEDAAAQREKQIEIMQAQLDYWQESGALWGEVDKLISEGFNGDGSLIRGSELEKVLQNADNYKAMSQAQRDNWANDLILETNQVGAHILEMAKGTNVNADHIRALLSDIRGQLGGTPEHSFTAEKAEEKYATGGLNTYTGLAHLDGTPSAPEYVLNPEQTNAFLRLADVLPSVMSGSPAGGASYGGNIYLNLDMHVDEIANDYDVDKIADRVKDILYNASSYRNVNTLNFIR